MACHAQQATTHKALDLLNQTIELRITETQTQSTTHHFYGQFLNENVFTKIRIFPGLKDKPDIQLAGLLKLDSNVINESGLRLKCIISDKFENKKIKWSGRALPITEQNPADQKIIEHLLNIYAQQAINEVPRSPEDVVTAITCVPDKITSSKQPNQAEILGIAAYEGRNPMELLTPSTARCQGKTDYALMAILRVIASELGCEVCDLINEVMWESVKSGRAWRCQPRNGMP